MSLSSCCVIVFAKRPVLGEVKTRLAKKTGKGNAVRIYKAMLQTLLAKLSSQNTCNVELWCYPDAKHPFLRKCASQYGVVLKRQRGKDLGMKMGRALKLSLKKYKTCILVGTDIPDIDCKDINVSHELLNQGNDLVILPTFDGGYGLIGMQRHMPFLFRNIAWSTARVMKQTLHKVEKSGLRYCLLERKMDIDTKEDLANYQFARGVKL